MIDVHSEEYILGQNIKKYRMLKRWTQSKLSEVTDIDRAEISKYESGQNGEMGFKMLKRFAKALTGRRSSCGWVIKIRHSTMLRRQMKWC